MGLYIVANLAFLDSSRDVAQDCPCPSPSSCQLVEPDRDMLFHHTMKDPNSECFSLSGSCRGKISAIPGSL